MAEHVLEAVNITKRFPGVTALDGVEFRVRPGEVHALLGENGAGKSTLIKILFGIYQRDGGHVIINGQPVNALSPRLAHDLGMAMIPQERTLVSHMTVAENLFLGRESEGVLGLIRQKKIHEQGAEYLRLFEVEIDSHARASSLGAGAQQLVELVRALMGRAQIVFMDEPTSGLTDVETQTLFRSVEKLRKQGVAVVYITHRLEEVFQLADRVTVLRDGRTIATINTDETSSAELVKLMAGKAVSEKAHGFTCTGKQNVLAVKGLNKPPKLSDISLEVKKGEIVGLAGLLGSGRTELLKCIFGSGQADSGTIEINGEVRKIRCPADAIAAGIGLLTDDRRREGLCLDMSSADNLVLASSEKVYKKGVVMEQQKKSIARQAAEHVSFDPGKLKYESRTLSGGNQQKVLLARWLSRNCDVLLLDEPTVGVDVGAKAEIHDLIREVAREGKGVLVASSDFPELLNLCHRILVLHDGRITMSLSNSGLTESELLGYAAGQEWRSNT